MSKRERIMAALFDLLRAKLDTNVQISVARDMVVPTDVPRQGLVILRDGNPGEPEVTMSPLTYHYEHRAEIEVMVQGDVETRIARFDALCGAIGAIVIADRTLGGACDWVEAQAPEFVDLPVEGAAAIRAATIPVMLHYSTTDPLN